MTSKVTYTGDLRTVCVHLKSGSEIQTDAPTDNQGKGERFSPTDLVATALASCILTTLGIAAKTHHYNIDGAWCEVEKVMASEPRRIAGIKVRLHLPPDQSYTDKQKIIIANIANTCPVAISLHPDCIREIVFHW